MWLSLSVSADSDRAKLVGRSGAVSPESRALPSFEFDSADANRGTAYSTKPTA